MSWRDILKGVKDVLEKGATAPQTGQRSRKFPGQAQEPLSHYERIVAWIRTNYGSRFKEGAKIADVELQLQGIVKELESKEDFKKHPKMINGFRAYINEREYGDLVRVTE